ncbi:MAG TPA: flavodoxin reductase [Cyclobacteriaceae bacterium]
MEKQTVKILSADFVTHNVRRFKLEKPSAVTFIPGQAADISINKPKWIDEKRPFTFTGLTHWDHLEFTIKIYPDHHGVTGELGKLVPGDELIIHDVFGTIHYKGEGVFIAGGAGVTPFIAILREMQDRKKLGNNTLLFSNRTSADIILKDEFQKMLGARFINTLDTPTPGFDNRKIDSGYIKEKIKNLSQYFYICGPDPMVEAIKKELMTAGVAEEKIVIEQF